MESTEGEYHGRLDAAPSKAGAGSTPARDAHSAMNSRVAPMPIGTVRVDFWPKLRASQDATWPPISG